MAAGSASGGASASSPDCTFESSRTHDSLMPIALGLILGLLPVVAVLVGWRRTPATRDIPATRALAIGTAACVLAVLCGLAEGALWRWTGLSLIALPGKESEA